LLHHFIGLFESGFVLVEVAQNVVACVFQFFLQLFLLGFELFFYAFHFPVFVGEVVLEFLLLLLELIVLGVDFFLGAVEFFREFVELFLEVVQFVFDLVLLPFVSLGDLPDLLVHL
jgi:hypothetical protein